MNNRGRNLLLTVACGTAALAVTRLQAAPQDAQAAPEAAPVAIALPAQPPKGAITLFGGQADQLSENWVERYKTTPPGWPVDANGVMTAKGHDITSKQAFGDCYIHVEFLPPVDASGKPVGHGNAGVGLQGRYEIQIMQSYGDKPEASNAGAFYSQKAARVNASKKPGEWQSFDILFRAPRFDDGGQVTEKARATVFHNGVLIHLNEDFNGPTGIQYGEFKGEAKTGPLILQGDHDPVQYRNVWVVPL